MRYHFKARSLKGEKQEGVLEAESKTHLAKLLRKQNLILIDAQPEGKEKRGKEITIPFLNRVSLMEKILFACNLKIMIGAGVSLPQALETLAFQTKSKKFREILLAIKDEILRGKNFSDSLFLYPDVFSEMFCNMVKVGEEGGRLQEALDTLSRQMERHYELQNKIRGAMVYPIVIISAMILIGVVMFIFVIPKISETFEELGVELPPTTRFVIKTGTLLSRYWYLVFASLPLLVIIFSRLKKVEIIKKNLDRIFLKIPIISGIVKKINSAYTVRMLSSLISSGVGIARALEIVSGALDNFFYKEAMIIASREVKKGKKLSEILKNYKEIYPLMVIQMISVGEQTGQTAEILEKLADFFEDEVANATKNLATIIEPLIMLLIGGVIGFFAVSMIQPMYAMLSAF